MGAEYGGAYVMPPQVRPPQPGMPQQAAPPQAPPPPAPPLPYTNTAQDMTEDDISDWRLRLTSAREPIAAIITEGKTNTSRYRVKHLKETPMEGVVCVQLDFSYTEQKKAQLISQMPEIHLEATRPEMESSAPIAQAIINAKLGPKPVGVDAITAIFEGMTDVVCGVGFMVCKVGYENYIDEDNPKQVQVGTEPTPGGQPGAILGLGAQPMQPVMQAVPNVISERFYCRRIPPGHFRAPNDFLGSDFDDAPWVGWRFSEDLPVDDATVTRRKVGSKAQNDDDLLLCEPAQTTRTKPRKRWGTEVFYNACRFDPTCKKPDLVRTFKLYDDEDTPSVHEDSKDQRWAPDGSLIGMPGYNLCVLTLRYTSDSCFPASDVQNTRQTVDEISTGRTQLLRRRDRSLPQTGYDATRVLPDTLAKIQKGESSAMIGFNGPLDDTMIRNIDKGRFGREGFEFNAQAQSDLDTAWALGANAGVLRSDSPETATKSQQIQGAVDTRLEAERYRVSAYCVTIAMKLFGLLQVWSDKADYVRLEGEAGAARMEQWTKANIPGPYAFKAKPDSHIRLDAATDREQALRAYNLLANDPYVRREELVKQVALKFGMDPQRIMKQPDPKGPDPANASISFKIEDFAGPAAPIAIELAAQAGYKISPQAMQAAQGFAQIWAGIQEQQAQAQAALKAGDTAHGGAAEQVPPLDKHQADLSGALPGIG